MNSLHDYRESVQSIPLPEAPRRSGGAAEAAVEAAQVAAAQPQTVIGSQLVEFDAAFPAEIRADCSNGFLLAQLASDRALKDSGLTGTEAAQLWQSVYVGTLSKLGWMIETRSESSRTASAASGHVHKEIIPVLTAALGGAAAAAVIIGILQGLQQMAADTPWITLFDRQSRRASASLFQVSYAELVAGNTPALKLVCFQLTAENQLTQVLFVKLAETSATLDHL